MVATSGYKKTGIEKVDYEIMVKAAIMLWLTTLLMDKVCACLPQLSNSNYYRFKCIYTIMSLLFYSIGIINI